MMNARTWMLGAAIVLAMAACERPEDQRTESIDAAAAAMERENWDPRAVARLDSGSAAYRADSFAVALEHYQAVTEIDPSIAAGWFGVYMAELALGNTAEAEAALERARDRAPGATLIQDVAGDTLS